MEAHKTKILGTRQGRGAVMSVCAFTIASCIFSVVAVATPPPKQEIDAALATLKQQFPKFDWQADTAVLIDINADGVEDVAALGYTKDTAAVGVVLGNRGKGVHIATYQDFLRCGPNGQPAIYGCKGSLTVTKEGDRLKKHPGKKPEGYVGCDKCYEIDVVGDEGGAPVVIYWDTVRKGLNWWQAGLWGRMVDHR